jgi:hypothetical protein
MRAAIICTITMLGVVPVAAQTAIAPTPMAAPTSCKAQATEKKLAGAAQKSFLTKCEKDSKATCDTSATEKKLSGAARTSFTKKCVNDAVGT